MNDVPPASRRWLTRLTWGLTLVPALLLLLYVAVYAVDGPEWDTTTSAEIFDRWDRGQFTLEYLFRQHNEHRKAVPRLVILGLGKLTHWDNRAEMYAHLALMAATGLVLFAAFRRDTTLGGDRIRALLAFSPIAWLLASPRSYDALLGDGFPHYCSILGFAAALALLAFARRSAGTLAGAIACGLAATFSISNGLLVWPIGLLILLCDLRSEPPRGVTRRRAAIWSAAGALTIAAYFYHYQDPGNHSSIGFIFEHPGIALGHYLTVNGSSLAPDPHGALLFGAIILVLDALALLLAGEDWWRRRQRPPFGAWLIVTAVVSSLMITLNRAGLGVAQALASRYTGISVLAPIGLYWIAVARRDRWLAARPMITALATLMLVGYLSASVDAWAVAPWWYSRKSWMAYLDYSAKYQARSRLETLYANGEHARVYSAAMERLHLNVFADPHVEAATLVRDSPPTRYFVERIDGEPSTGGVTLALGADDEVTIEGAAFNRAFRGPAHAVFLTIDGTRELPAHIGIYRPDLGGGIRGRGRRWSGFKGSFGGFVLEPGEHTLALTIVPEEGTHAFVTPVVARITRR